MSMPPGMLGALLGGVDLASLMPELPCALCILDDPHDEQPAPQGVTLAGGTLVCRDHVRAALPARVEHDSILTPVTLAGIAAEVAAIRAGAGA